MAKSTITTADRDGTSQSGRQQQALQPGYVAMDEHTLQDWLRFAQAYAKELKYYGPDDTAAGDWQGFLNPDELDESDLAAWLQQMADFADRPEAYADAGDDNLQRPHLILFLVFLQLLRQVQGRLNDITRRHLDFYYRRYLQLQRKPAEPDSVHLLIEPSSRVAQVLLPAGTAVDAGKDSQGNALVYRTDGDLVANHARIERLSSVYLHRQITGIREAREQYAGPKNEAVVEMLKIPFGVPAPGDDMPAYPPLNQAVDFPFLQLLQSMLAFIDSGLFLSLEEFRSLVQLKQRREQADGEWQEINDILDAAGKQRSGAGFTLAPADPRDFDANLTKAVGVLDFKGLPEIKNVYELYDQRTRQDAQQFIADNLYMSYDQFVRMMQIKVRIDNEWREINTLLERAGQRKRNDPKYSLGLTDPASPAFSANFTAALGTPDYTPFQTIRPISDLDELYATLLELEGYFFMPGEQFADMMDTAGQEAAPPQDWDEVYANLAGAYQQKVYAARRQALRALLPDNPTPDQQKAAFENMLRLVLAAPPTEDGALLFNRLADYLPPDQDMALLQQAADGVPLSADDWDKVYALLELAWRNRLGSEPVAQKVEWLNLYAQADATSVSVAREGDSPRWRTFGQGQNSDASAPAPAPTLGWAVSSPLLCLSQGQRTVTLTLGFSAEQYDAKKIAAVLTQAFLVQVSSAKGWLTPGKATAQLVDYPDSPSQPKLPAPLKALQWRLEFDESAPPLEAYADTGIGGNHWPTLRLMLQPRLEAANGGSRYVTDYPLFQPLAVEQVLLQVDVVGMTQLPMQNDEAALNAAKPFAPFGNQPAAGSRFYFGHPELSAKPLSSLTAHLQWMGLPSSDLGSHYQAYDAGIKDNTSFNVKVCLVDRRLELELDAAAKLFEATDAGLPHAVAIADVPASIQGSRPGYVYRADLSPATESDIKSWNRYLLWELQGPDFQHHTYPTVAGAKSIALAAAIAAGSKDLQAAAYQVNPPYTPKLKSLSLDYTAAVEIAMNRHPSGGADQLFHLHPFGYAEVQSDPASGRYPLLPGYDNEGELYVGLSGVEQGQILSLLLQMAEGSADPDLQPAPVQWSYLSGNQWRSLHDGHLRSDATRGLQGSGIVELQTVAAAAPNTLLPGQLYWLRLTVQQGCDSVCDAVDFHPQAVRATFVDQGNAPDHLCQPLPARTIRKPLEPMADIAAISQPYTSFGGRPAEEDARFNTRVSEHLRHKNRALSPWDYERLVLERFPQIYKAKCLRGEPTSLADNLGRLDVVVIPDIRHHLPFDPFEPKAPARLLAEIQDFLAQQAPPFADLRVANAHYLPVKLRFAVRFSEGCDPGFYKQRLNEELNHYLSPWAYDKGEDVVIGGKIYANAIIDFIERCGYVDYVAQFKLFLGDEKGENFSWIVPPPEDSYEGYAVQAERPDSVLVAARQHEIDLITENRFVDQEFTGIDYMKVELDFIVG